MGHGTLDRKEPSNVRPVDPKKAAIVLRGFAAVCQATECSRGEDYDANWRRDDKK